MRKSDLLDLSIGEIMGRWPSTIRLVIEHHMHCVGCPISPFHTLVDAAKEHGLPVDTLVAEVAAVVAEDEARAKGGRA